MFGLREGCRRSGRREAVAAQLALAPDAAPFAATVRSQRDVLLSCRVKGRAGEAQAR